MAIAALGIELERRWHADRYEPAEEAKREPNNQEVLVSRDAGEAATVEPSVTTRTTEQPTEKEPVGAPDNASPVERLMGSGWRQDLGLASKHGSSRRVQPLLHWIHPRSPLEQHRGSGCAVRLAGVCWSNHRNEQRHRNDKRQQLESRSAERS